MKQDRDLEKRIREEASISEDDVVHLDIVLEDERPISRVSIKEREVVILGCRTKVGSIGGVATEEEYRERGLATRLMERSAQRINDDQGDIMLVSGDRDLYRRQGCVRASTFFRFKITRSDLGKFDSSDVRFVPYSDESLLSIASIYQKETVRFHRTLEDFRALLERVRPAPFWTKPDVFLLQEDGEFLGYMVTQEPRDEKSKGRVRAIAEYAGVRKTVANSIKPLFARYKIEELVFFVPGHDVEFIHILKRRGLAGEKGNLRGHTFKIINLPRLMERFTPYIEERIGRDKASLLKFSQEGGKFSIVYKDERLEPGVESLTMLIFGAHDEADPVRRDSQSTKKEIMGEMGELLQALFPLPFPLPGLNSY